MPERIKNRDKRTNGEQYQRTQMQKDNIIRRLRENGCRITKQRRMLLDIILEDECSSCKEIYYKALLKDSGIGSATVYRMINTLEDIGAISRKNMYRIGCEGDCVNNNACTVELSDNGVCELSARRWRDVLEAGLRACGYIEDQNIRTIVLHPCNDGECS